MKLNIKNMQDGSKFSVDIDEGGTVRDLKRELAARTGCKSSRIRLVHSSAVLAGSQPLSSLRSDPPRTLYLYVIARRGADGVDEEDRRAFFAAAAAPPAAAALHSPRVAAGLSDVVRGLEQLRDAGDGRYDAILSLMRELHSRSASAVSASLAELAELGAPPGDCAEALSAARGSVDDAIGWLIDNNKIC